MKSTDDLDLAKQIAKGNETALATFYTRYADSLFAFIYHHLDKSRPDAEDIWQDTLLAALRAMPSFRGQSHMFTWLCSIARHKIADFFRQRGSATINVFSDVSETQLSTLVSSTPQPEDMVIQQATRIRVIEALALLTEDYRTALVARYADERSVDEVARLLGRTYKATESLLSRARVAFREALISLEKKTR